jgi:exopolysaccharide production protein ExoY
MSFCGNGAIFGEGLCRTTMTGRMKADMTMGAETDGREIPESSAPPEGACPASQTRFSAFYQTRLKRAFDLVFGAILLVCFAPLMALAWLAVRLTSPGPGFFAQPRVGLGGQLITVYKLRSMHINQEQLVDMGKVRAEEAQGILHKSEDDPRVTAVGKIMRKLSIDELPQLWNVVRGDMSLVGPRPLVAYMLEPHPDIKRVRCRVRPGITGEWQVEAREENTSIAGMVKYDLHYVRNYSLAMDLRILLKTIIVVLGARGAH